jgi:hypothetical protein
MARMFPINGPEIESTSFAEKMLYELFHAHLSDRFWVWHSVPWHDHNQDDEPRDGEADFYILHPSYGILTLEVKGGTIRQDPDTRRWYTRNRNGETILEVDPMRQARRSKYALRRKLKESPITGAYALKGRYPIAYGVWFPQTRWMTDGVTMRGDEYFVLDQRDLHEPEQSILRVMQRFASKDTFQPLHDTEMNAAINVIGDRLTPEAIGIMSKKSPDDGSKIERMSPPQFARLEALWKGRRVVLVFGPAGSGKTLLATELASRFAAAGERVLYLIRNQHMANWLRRRAEQDERWRQAPFEIHSIKSLVREIATKGGIRAQGVARLNASTKEGQHELGLILGHNIRALKVISERMPYTAILVDDAEDIEQELCVPIQQLLENPRTGLFFAFGDEMQRVDIAGRWIWRPGDMGPSAYLTEVWRNARPIHEKLREFNPALDQHLFLGTEGHPIRYIDPKHIDASHAKPRMTPLDVALNLALKDIYVHLPGVAPEDILIISCRSRERSHWSHEAERALCHQRLRWIGDGAAEGTVTLATIRTAKGLEYKAVVLAELDGIAPNEAKRTNLLYVAISRATHYLVVLGAPDDVQVRQRMLT